MASFSNHVIKMTSRVQKAGHQSGVAAPERCVKNVKLLSSTSHAGRALTVVSIGITRKLVQIQQSISFLGISQYFGLFL